MMMKQNNQISRVSAKIKRTTPFIVIATGERVKFNILCPDGRYLVDFEDGSFNDFDKSELKPVNEARAPIKKVVRPVSAEERQTRESLDEFYDRMALIMPYNCENCNKPLYAFTKKAKRSVSAHILPKSIFTSIATDPANLFFMGADFIGCPCNCHDRWDMNSDIRVTMNVYPIALERFETDLKHKLTPGELKQAFTYLKLEWQ